MVDLLKNFMRGKRSGIKLGLASKSHDPSIKFVEFNIIQDIILPLNNSNNVNYVQISRQIIAEFVKFVHNNYFVVLEDDNDLHYQAIAALTQKDVIILGDFDLDNNNYRICFASHNGDVEAHKMYFYQYFKDLAKKYF